MKRLLATATLIAFFISIIPNSYAAVTAGTKCKVIGSKKTVGSKIYTCTSGKWSAGVRITKPKPKPTPTLTPTPSTKEKEYFNLLLQNVISGGPPKDGIPAVEKPEYTSVEEANKWLLPNDIVFGIDYQGFVAAYPQRILVWHEIVNEKINGEQVSVTYCPLTGTIFGFKGEIAPGVSTTFGVSGKLVNSNVIMYDRKTDSYWSQILGKAFSGQSTGKTLDEFPTYWTTWERWKKKYPDTKVLSRATGFIRDYGVGSDPYGSYTGDFKGYYTSPSLIFEPIYKDTRLQSKTVVVGIRDGKGNAFAVLKDTLRAKKVIEFQLGKTTIVITYDEKLDAHRATMKETGKWINSVDAMWFAWAAFYPDTKLLR